MRFIFSIQYQVGYTEAAFVYGDAKTQPIRWRDTASASAWRIRCKARADIARQIAHVQNAARRGRRSGSFGELLKGIGPGQKALRIVGRRAEHAGGAGFAVDDHL